MLINPQDMQENGWKLGDLLDITSHFSTGDQEELRTAPCFFAVPYDIPRNSVGAYFPEANVLVPIDSVALRSNTPTSKAVVVTFTRAISEARPTQQAAVESPA